MYNSDFDDAAESLIAMGVVFIIVFAIIMIAIAAFSIVVMWKLFEKAGEEGWKCLIPFYNLYVLAQIAYGHNPAKNGMCLAIALVPIGSFIPYVGFLASIAELVLEIMMFIELARAFGKSDGFAVGLILIGIVFMAIIAFDKDTFYQRGVNAQGMQGYGGQPYNTQPNYQQPYNSGQQMNGQYYNQPYNNGQPYTGNQQNYQNYRQPYGNGQQGYRNYQQPYDNVQQPDNQQPYNQPYDQNNNNKQ